MWGRGGPQHPHPSLGVGQPPQPSVLPLSRPTPPFPQRLSPKTPPKITGVGRGGCLSPRRAPGCCLSTKAGSRSLLAALASKAKRINGRYERFLERTFPRFYVLYATFTKGESGGRGRTRCPFPSRG